MDKSDWMYSGWKRGRPTCDWVKHANEFLDFAFSNESVVQEGTIKCPCAVCRNYFRHKRGKVELHNQWAFPVLKYFFPIFKNRFHIF